MLNPEKKAIASIVLGIISLTPFLLVILISKFFWSISISNNFLIFLFFAAILSGCGGLFFGKNSLKDGQKIGIIGIILSAIGLIISLYFLCSSFYLAQFS